MLLIFNSHLRISRPIVAKAVRLFPLARQALVKLVLKPEWEAKFEGNVYGFRPGRSTWDAIQAILSYICRLPKCVLDADIEKCLDRINHEVLLDKLKSLPATTALFGAG